MNLIQQLQHGTVYEGLPMPPNRLMLQAATALGQLEGINLTNNSLIQQLQASEAQNLEIIKALRKEIEQLKVQQKTLYGTIYDYESIRKNSGQTTDVGSGDAGHTGSDSSSEGNTTNTAETDNSSVSNKSQYFAGGVNETNS